MLQTTFRLGPELGTKGLGSDCETQDMEEKRLQVCSSSLVKGREGLGDEWS